MHVLKPHVFINVSNIEASVVFYEKAFGVRTTKRRPGYEAVTENNAECCYEIQDRVWIEDPDGNSWKVSFVKADAQRMRPGGSEEARRAEEGRRAEEHRRQADESRRRDEENRRADEARRQEEGRRAEEHRRQADESRRQADEARRAEEGRRAEEHRRQAEESRRQEEERANQARKK